SRPRPCRSLAATSAPLGTLRPVRCGLLCQGGCVCPLLLRLAPTPPIARRSGRTPRPRPSLPHRRAGRDALARWHRPAAHAGLRPRLRPLSGRHAGRTPMLTVPPGVELWYCPDAVDMRLGFDGLFALVRNRLQADPLSGHLFIFRKRLADRLEVLYRG